ncbi:MAG: transcription termination/antitermination protein NusA [Deferribacteres bacterium]|jgi:N utilization substance protein A|nr:NusA antitermination factor [Deferribacteraceae bacterium]MDK2792456.1 transcription termination/antitermination protein NusA [Deferribacteres bacterium]
MSRELAKVADELGREKGLSRKMLGETLKEAIITAVQKKIGKYGEPEVSVDLEKGVIDILIPKEVSEEIDSRWHEISIEEAKKYKENPQLGDIIMVPTTLEALGRQAAIAAKNKLLEKIRDAEKQVIYDQFQNKVGEIVNGIVLKADRDNLVVSIGKTEAILPKRESIPADFFGRSDYVRALLLEIRVVRGWPQLILSRTHPDFLKKLFEMEIPEVYEGIIEVKGVAREPGDRAKVAVYSTNSNIDPVGACIGLKGVRINSISQELRGEKIDVIEWSPDPVKYVCNAISPAEVLLTNIFEDEETIEVVVPDDELSLAIGKKGQNVKLAAMLTGWRLDVLKESEYNEIRKARMAEQEQEFKEFDELYNLEHIEVLTPEMIAKLFDAGLDDVEKLSTSSVEEVMAALDTDEENAINIINSAIDYLQSKLSEIEDGDPFGEEDNE